MAQEIIVGQTRPYLSNKISIFDKLNAVQDIKKWRYQGLSYRNTIKEFEKKYNVQVSYMTLYNFCVRNGLDGDMSGEREKTVNVYNDLQDSLRVVNNSLAINQAILEEIQTTVGTEEFDSKLYIATQTALDKLLARRESLLKSILNSQALVYKYQSINKFMDKAFEVIKEYAGTEVLNAVTNGLKTDFTLKELMKQIPKEEEVVINPTQNSVNKGATKKRLGVSL